jgi:5-methyltetrahydrofolate--homocysteine methyltransferase
MKLSIQELLQTRDWLLADGATGSNLFEVGLVSGDAPELWNIDHPDRIANLHKSFIDAGSDIVLTNTFGGTRYRLQLHQSQDRVKELNQAAVKIARGEADKAGRPVLVAGSMGPTGEILEPVGPVSIAQAQDAFKEQADALAQAGADLLWIETLSSEQEIEAAVNAAKSTGLPVVCTLSFDTNGRTMMGIAPGMFAKLDATNHLLACGANCGVGPAETIAGILNLARDASPQTVLVAKANCGIPNYVDGQLEYDGTPDLMAQYACMAVDAGARIIGGCCGTSPSHVKAMRTALQAHEKRKAPTAQDLTAVLGEISTGARAQLDGKMTRADGSASGNAPKKRRRRA